MSEQVPDRKIVGIRARQEALSRIVGQPVTVKPSLPSCCDESEGLTVEESAGTKVPEPANPFERRRWKNLVEQAERGGPTRQ